MLLACAGVNFILVYDFGGGTLDVSVLHVSEGYVEVMGSEGDEFLGGSDFDRVIMEKVRRRSTKPGEERSEYCDRNESL